MKLDQLTLDAMVCGTEQDPEAWKSLLIDPDREKKWHEAVVRREQLDRFCSFAANWPTLAKSYRQLKKTAKAALSPPRLSCVPDTSFQVGSPFAAVMSSASKKKDDDLLILSELPWGEQRIMAVTAPQSIAFKCDSDIDIYFEYSNGKGWISSKDTWSLEKAEGAVVLTFCHVSERLSDDRDTVIQQSESVATIVFLPG